MSLDDMVSSSKGSGGKGGKGGKEKATPTFGKQKRGKRKGLLEELQEALDSLVDSARSTRDLALDLLHTPNTATYRLTLGVFGLLRRGSSHVGGGASPVASVAARRRIFEGLGVSTKGMSPRP